MINQVLSTNMCLHRPYLYLNLPRFVSAILLLLPLSLLYALREAIIGHLFWVFDHWVFQCVEYKATHLPGGSC